MAGLGSCSCSVSAGGADLQYAGDASQAPSSGKPVWSLDQIVANLMRWDARWEAPLSIPFSFYEVRPAHLANEPLYQGFVPFDAAQRLATRTALDLIADVANVKFVEVPDDGADPGPATARLTYARGDWGHANATGAANVDISEALLLGDAREIYAAELSFNTQRWSGPALPGSRPFYIILHETMHALGFPHPGQYNRTGTAEITFLEHAEYSQDTAQYTVLSYFSATHTGGDFQGAFASTLMLHDIAALQAVYGPNMTTRTGDTTYGFESNAGGVYDFAVHARPVMSIWDAGGIDTINLSGFSQPARLDLNAGAFSDVAGMRGNLSIAFGVVIENAVAGISADVIIGNGAGNHVLAGAGDDRVEGRAGDDALHGGAGDDLLVGGSGSDTLDGGDGVDTVSYDDVVSDSVGLDLATGSATGSAGADRLLNIENARGSNGADTLTGSDGANRLEGLTGRDTLSGGGGDDTLIGGADADLLFGDLGDDVLGGELGDDRIEGGAGFDRLWGDAGNDLLIGGADRDELRGGDGDDVLGGGDGDDYLEGAAGRDALYGDAGNDLAVGGAGDDVLLGQDGEDVIGGQDGNDRLEGGSGRDALYGDAGNDLLIGGADNDQLRGQDGDDVAGGGDGDDYLEGNAGQDQLYGDAGNDLLIGGAGADLLLGQDGDDVIGGQDGNDQIFGGAGADKLFGDAADDVIEGGAGRDEMYGQGGADRFVFGATSDSAVGAADRIFDFDLAGGDLIDLSRIDANVNSAGDQAFVFASAFSNQAGQAVLSFDSGANTTTLRLDVNGDGQSDFDLLISGNVDSSSGWVL